MITVNYHLLAILPTLLFVVGVAIRFVSQQNMVGQEDNETVREKLKEQFLYSFNLEAIFLATINGIILGELSGSFSAGTGFLLFGMLLGIMIMSLLKNGYEDLSEYLLAIMALLFLYEFIYFLTAGTYARVLGGILIGWQIAVSWFFGLIGTACAVFFLIVFLRMRNSGEE